MYYCSTINVYSDYVVDIIMIYFVVDAYLEINENMDMNNGLFIWIFAVIIGIE